MLFLTSQTKVYYWKHNKSNAILCYCLMIKWNVPCA